MPPTQHSEDGNVNFTVKELLEDLNRKVDSIDEKLDRKAERERVHDLANRVSVLELTSVKREGPVMQEIRDYEKRLEVIAAQLQRFENGVGDRIQKAISDAKEAATVAADRSFSRREKLIVGFAALIGAFGTLISTAVLLIQLTHH